MTLDEININKNAWLLDHEYRKKLNMESVAGYGSSLWNTHEIIEKLPEILSKYKIKSMLDIPCSDVYWMSKINMDHIHYIGADLIDEQISENKKTYPNKDFRVINMIVDPIPIVDLIFCRDCFVHMTFKNIKSSLNKFCTSKSKYLFAGTCPELKINRDSHDLLGWRPLNLEIQPFNFSTPIEIFSEQTDKNPEKCMGMWELSVVKKIL